jgi:hypothetical protein
MTTHDHPRFGWRRSRGFVRGGSIGSTLRPHPGEQRTIGQILALAAYGLGPERTARWLNAHPEHEPRGARWYPQTVRRVLWAEERAARRAR